MEMPGFDTLYRDVPAEKREELRSFRLTHPYQKLEVNGVGWEFIASGQGKQALLLLGGGASVGETGFKTIQRMEKYFRVISPSYPPVGKMSVVSDGLGEILDREGFQKAHVTGHSLGAAVGHVFVRLQPQRVDKLVLDGFGLYTPSHTRAARLFFKLPSRLIYAYYRRVFRVLLKNIDPSEKAFMSAYIEELFTRLHSRETFLGQFNLLIDIFDHAEQYRVFQPVERQGRVLLVLAEDDRGFSPAEREALKASYPGARVHSFASGGHMSGWTHTEEFNRVVDEFLAEMPETQAATAPEIRAE